MRELREWIVSRPIRGRTTGTVRARSRAEAERLANDPETKYDVVNECDFDVVPAGKWVVDREDAGPGARGAR
jgi:hypothetical protein